MKYHRPLFHIENWRRPYHAMGQTLMYRAASHALYFPIEQWTRTATNSNLLGGMLAGIYSMHYIHHQSMSIMLI